MLSDNGTSAELFDQELAMGGSSVWEWRPKRGKALTRQYARQMSERVAKVTVTGPEFVALSSGSGKFPLTLFNGLDVPVTVTVNMDSVNPAITFESLAPVVLDPGQRRDVEVVSRASGSGVTVVHARLGTEENRGFGQVWSFDVRATHIGLAIWILMVVLGLALFSGAGIRIVQRFRGGGFRPRGQTP